MSQGKEVLQLIDADKLNLISDFITKSGHSTFVKKRQMVMIALLAFSGVRLSELEFLTIDCIKISPSSQTIIRIPAVKRSNADWNFHLVTIPSTFAMELQKYIALDRYRIVSKTCRKRNDSGALLINEKTGLKLSSRDLFHDISVISKATGIDIKISAGLFRQQVSSLFVHKLHSLNSGKEYELSEADRVWDMSKYYTNKPTEVAIDLHLLDAIDRI